MIKSGMKLRRVKERLCSDDDGACVFYKSNKCVKMDFLTAKGFRKFACKRDRWELVEENNEQSKS